MKIGNPADKRNVAATDGKASAKATSAPAAKPAEATPPQTAADPSVKVQLSSGTSAAVSNADTAAFDADKVARVTQSIADGKYQVNAEVIADKLISNAQELLGKVQR